MRVSSAIRPLLYAIAVLGLFAATFGMVPASLAQIGISVNIAPPELPVYEQPAAPGEDYIWVPGYWAYDDDYYWVPGTWVMAPQEGYLWTPGYWGWRDNGYFFNDGYWGPEVGFYGGINYGFGYFGHGFEGGRWDRGHFYYNRAVTNVNVNITRNVYETRVNQRTETRVSFNGGRGGINDRADSREEAAARQRHIGPVAAQNQHVQAARSDRELHVSENHGRPPIAATPRAGEIHDNRVVGNGGRTVNNPNRPEVNSGNRPANVVHPKDVGQHERPAAPNTGNVKMDQKYQQQQQKLQQKQDQEHQKLQQKQDQDHQRQTQQKASDSRQQQMEQQHQRQTQQLEQKHAQQQQQQQQRQQPRQQQESRPTAKPH